MQLSEKAFANLVRFKKIQDCIVQVLGYDWFFKKLSKNPKKVWLQGVEFDDIVEFNITDIETIAYQAIDRYLDAVNMDNDGNLTYLEIDTETDFNNDIKGKKEYSYNDIPLINNMSIVFNKDKDSTIRGRVFKIRGVGLEEGIQLKNIKGRPRASKGE